MPETEVRSHFGVYAFIFKDATKQELLVIKKARGPYTGRYDLPGGSLEPKELIEEGLVREIQEEVGCETESFKEIGSVSTLFKYTQEDKEVLFRHIGVLFEVTIHGTPKEDADGEDSNGCIWVPIQNILPEQVSPFVIEGLRKLNLIK